MGETVLAVVTVWLACDVFGFWTARTVLAERGGAFVRQLDIAIWVSGLALAAAAAAYILLGVE